MLKSASAPQPYFVLFFLRNRAWPSASKGSLSERHAVGHAAPLHSKRPTTLSHPAWQWDEQAVQSTNQRMEGLASNALLVQLYQPDLLSTGPAAKVRIGKVLAGGGDPDGTVSPQGPVWIGEDFRLDRTPRAAASTSTPGGGSGGGNNSTPRRPHWRRGHWHTVLHGEKRQSRRMQWFQPVYVGLG